MKMFFTALAIATLPMTAAIAQAPTTGPAYVAKAGASDQYEIQSSKLVLATTKNAGLRRFADMMVADHTKSTADVKAAATSAGLTVAPPRLDAMGLKNVAALRATKGTMRDTLYIRQQKAAHQRALALHQGYAADGSVASLKTAAAAIAPVVQTHIDELQSM